MDARFGRTAFWGAGGWILGQQEAVHRFWEELPWLVLWMAVAVILVVVAWWVAMQIRPNSAQKERPTSQWLAKCREMHDRGVLSDEEFRTIKTRLAKELQDELEENGKED